MHLETRRPESAMRVVNMPNLEDLTKSLRAVIFSSVPGSSLFFWTYLMVASCQLLLLFFCSYMMVLDRYHGGESIFSEVAQSWTYGSAEAILSFVW